MRQVKLQKKINAAKDKWIDIMNDNPKVKGTGASSSYQPSIPANDNATRYKAPNATVSKINSEREKWEKGLSGNVPMGSGSKSKPSSSSGSSYKNRN